MMLKNTILFYIVPFLGLVFASKQRAFKSKVQADADPCKQISGSKIISYHEAISCYKTFEFNETIRSQTIDTISKTIPFYAFLHISKDSPEPRIPLQVDLEKQLQIISGRFYQTDLEFQTEITELFRSLNDGHTGYHSSCFSTFIFRQPFPLVTVNEPFVGQKFLILNDFELADGLDEAWLEEGIDVYKYAGSEVLLIDGIPTLSYLIHYVNTKVGSSKDLNSRINLALARVMQRDGRWGIANGAFASSTSVPSHPAITYTLKLKHGGVETITVPYLVSNPDNFSNKSDFYQNNCAYKPYRIKSANPGFEPMMPKKLRVMQVPAVTHEKLDSNLSKHVNSWSEDPLSKPLTKGEVISTWLLSNKTGVMTITSFVARSENTFINEAAIGFKALFNKGVEELVLDVSNNGGGVICWGYYILDYLFPNSKKRYFDTDMHVSKLLMMMSERDRREEGFFNPRYWLKSNGRKFNSTLEFIGDNRFKRGGTISHYTEPFDDQCGINPLHFMIDGQDANSLYTRPAFRPGKLTVVTNSVCYSTCSLLVNGLQELHGVQTYAMGGVRGEEATSCSIQGGTVYNLDALLEDIQELGLQSHPEAPQHFPTDASLSFTIREAYSTQKFGIDPKYSQEDILPGPRPLEFTWTPAQYHVQYPGLATLMSPYQQWRQIAHDFFSKK